MIELSSQDGGVVLPVLARAGARRDAIAGERAGALLVSVTRPPEKGKANAAIQSLLAQALGYRPSQITLLTGQTSRQKRFLIAGASIRDLTERLAKVSLRRA
jgi:uncharacterized protein YggU (UPF0235/DUF167 family)